MILNKKSKIQNPGSRFKDQAFKVQIQNLKIKTLKIKTLKHETLNRSALGGEFTKAQHETFNPNLLR